MFLEQELDRANPGLLCSTKFLPLNKTPVQTASHTNGGVSGASDHPPAVTATPLAQTGFFQGESYSVGSNGIVVIDGTTFATATPTTATLSDGKVVIVWPNGSVSIQEAKDLAPPKKIYITPKEYVLGAFVPTILAVLYSIPWHLLASAIQDIEPFYQLQRPEGVTAANSIALDYRSSINVIATFRAIIKGHFLVWWSGLISLVVLMVAPLASETVFIGFTGKCTTTSGREACSPSLSVFPTAARVLEGMLAFIAVLTLALAISIKRGKSGVYANPLSIAALATLFQNPHVIESFRQLNPYCTSSRMIRASLQGHRYRLTSYVSDDGTGAYGLVMCYQDPAMIQTNYRTAFLGGKRYASVAVNAVDERTPLKRQRTISDFFIHPAAIITFALLVVALEVLVIYYSKNGGDTGFERFMDSQSFGVGFLFTAVGVLLKMYWTLLDDGKLTISYALISMVARLTSWFRSSQYGTIPSAPRRRREGLRQYSPSPTHKPLHRHHLLSPQQALFQCLHQPCCHPLRASHRSPVEHTFQSWLGIYSLPLVELHQHWNPLDDAPRHYLDALPETHARTSPKARHSGQRSAFHLRQHHAEGLPWVVVAESARDGCDGQALE